MAQYSAGRVLMEALAAKEMTQDALAKLLKLDPRYVTKLCRGYAGISVEMAIRIADAGIHPPAEFAEEYQMKDPAEQWAAISAAHQVSRMRQGEHKLEQYTTRWKRPGQTPVKAKPKAKAKAEPKAKAKAEPKAKAKAEPKAKPTTQEQES